MALVGGVGNDALIGGVGDDAYQFAAAAAAEIDIITELTGEGIDRLDFGTLAATIAVKVNLLSDIATATHTNRTVKTAAVGQAINLENAVGGAGADSLSGNDGDNRLDGGLGKDTLIGVGGADMLVGGATGDSLVGGLGNDTLIGGDGGDTMLGGAGDDVYVFTAVTTAAIDVLTELANEGSDLLDFSGLSATISVTINLGSDTALATHANRTVKTAAAGQAANFERALGGAGNDSLTGNAAANRLDGGAGNDSLNGGAGNDSLIGGQGNDVFLFSAAVANETDMLTELANEGTDLLDFSAMIAAVPLTANLGSDAALVTHSGRTIQTAVAGQASNFENVLGGAGNDSLTGNAINNRLDGGAGNDTLNGAAGDDTLVGNAGNDALQGGVDNDVYLFFAATVAEIDTLTELANQGADLLDFSNLLAAVPVTVNLANDNGLASHANRTINATAGQSLNFENVVGGAGNDSLTGNSGANQLDGSGGNDRLEGLAGNDFAIGGAGIDDLIQTVDANQTLSDAGLTGLGTDSFNGVEHIILTGGNGENLLDASGFSGIAVLNGLGGNDTLIGGSGVDSISGGDGNDSLLGNVGNDTLKGGLGDDSLDGGVGNDVLLGEDGNDSLVGGLGNDGLNGGNGNDTLKGDAGNDTILGGAGADNLSGGTENDLLLGEADRDTLIGDDGADSLSGGSGKNTFLDVDDDEGDRVGVFTFDFNSLLIALP